MAKGHTEHNIGQKAVCAIWHSTSLLYGCLIMFLDSRPREVFLQLYTGGAKFEDLCPVLRSSVEERQGNTEESPAEGQDNKGSGASHV